MSRQAEERAAASLVLAYIQVLASNMRVIEESVRHGKIRAEDREARLVAWLVLHDVKPSDAIAPQLGRLMNLCDELSVHLLAITTGADLLRTQLAALRAKGQSGQATDDADIKAIWDSYSEATKHVLFARNYLTILAIGSNGWWHAIRRRVLRWQVFGRSPFERWLYQWERQSLNVLRTPPDFSPVAPAEPRILRAGFRVPIARCGGSDADT